MTNQSNKCTYYSPCMADDIVSEWRKVFWFRFFLRKFFKEKKTARTASEIFSLITHAKFLNGSDTFIKIFDKKKLMKMI